MDSNQTTNELEEHYKHINYELYNSILKIVVKNNFYIDIYKIKNKSYVNALNIFYLYGLLNTNIQICYVHDLENVLNIMSEISNLYTLENTYTFNNERLKLINLDDLLNQIQLSDNTEIKNTVIQALLLICDIYYNEINDTKYQTNNSSNCTIGCLTKELNHKKNTIIGMSNIISCFTTKMNKKDDIIYRLEQELNSKNELLKKFN